MSTERDELALELFIGDNFNQPREASIADWEYYKAEGRFRGRVEHYDAMASAALDVGYRKPRTVSGVGDYQPGWDDRKELADIWQDHAQLPSEGLTEKVYDALIHVARWGYERRMEEDLTP